MGGLWAFCLSLRLGLLLSRKPKKDDPGTCPTWVNHVNPRVTYSMCVVVRVYDWPWERKSKNLSFYCFIFAFRNTGLPRLPPIYQWMSMTHSLVTFMLAHKHAHTPVTHSVIVRGRQRRTAHNTSQHWVKTHNGYFARWALDHKGHVGVTSITGTSNVSEVDFYSNEQILTIAITPVFSITWSCRNHYNVLIC